MLIDDKHIELATTGSIEFEDVDLGEMTVEVQGRILEVRRRLELQLTCPKAKRKTVQSKGQRSYRVTGRGTNLFPRILSIISLKNSKIGIRKKTFGHTHRHGCANAPAVHQGEDPRRIGMPSGDGSRS